jgi:hypothetical protein
MPKFPVTHKHLLELGVRRLVVGCAVFAAALFQLIASTAYRVAFDVEKLPNGSYEFHFVPLVVAAVPSSLDWLQLRKLLFPVSQYVWLDRTQFADLTNRKVSFCRNRRKFFCSWIKHGHDD